MYVCIYILTLLLLLCIMGFSIFEKMYYKNITFIYELYHNNIKIIYL